MNKVENIVLRAENLAIGYKDKILCKDISFSVKAGSTIALMGVNGSGKSTLMRTLIGLLPAVSGDILINNKNLLNYSNIELAQKLSAVLTDHIPTCDLTVFETICFGRYPYTSWFGNLTSNDIIKVRAAINDIGLMGFEDRKLATLSDGEFQRVMIARAMAQETNLLFLDEPASHLDIPNKLLMVNIIKSLSEQKGKTILYSTHELSFIKKVATQLWIFDKNNNLIITNPAEAFEKGYIKNIFGNIEF